MKNIIVAGFDYKNSSLNVREKAAFTPMKIEKAYKKIKADRVIREAVILSTCNRSEIYAYVDNIEDKEYLKSFYAEFLGIPAYDIDKNIKIRTGTEAVNHIFEVSAGYRSMILGEDQILGQAKTAYELAIKNKSSGKILNRLFLDSITTAKKIKTLNGASGLNPSASSAGIKLFEQKMGSLAGKKALIIGLGKMNKIAVNKLLNKNMEKIFITNRTRKKTFELSDNSETLIGINFKDRYKFISEVDVIISCTSAPHLVINRENFVQYYQNQPLYILDMAMPRDIDPSLQELSGINLYKIDDFKKIEQENLENLNIAIEQGKKIIEKDIEKYTEWIEKSNNYRKIFYYDKLLSNYA